MLLGVIIRLSPWTEPTLKHPRQSKPIPGIAHGSIPGLLGAFPQPKRRFTIARAMETIILGTVPWRTSGGAAEDQLHNLYHKLVTRAAAVEDRGARLD